MLNLTNDLLTIALAGLNPGSGSTGCLGLQMVSPICASSVLFRLAYMYPTCPAILQQAQLVSR